MYIISKYLCRRDHQLEFLGRMKGWSGMGRGCQGGVESPSLEVLMELQDMALSALVLTSW